MMRLNYCACGSADIKVEYRYVDDSFAFTVRCVKCGRVAHGWGETLAEKAWNDLNPLREDDFDEDE